MANDSLPSPLAEASQRELDECHIRRALELAARGEGWVEPNPMVGCVVARGAQIVGEGWHQRFGGPHAEILALQAAGKLACGATLYVTLEPCCHQGKTPPCTHAILATGIRRVVAAQTDPFPQVAGQGLQALLAAGVAVDAGIGAEAARRLNAPYLKRVQTGRPWLIAKWAMTLDGKLATRDNDSRWISNETSRRLVHELRGRVDAVLVGRGTLLADDPLLTARPAGPRAALRVVLDSQAAAPLDRRLIATAREYPTLIAVAEEADGARVEALRAAGCETFACPGSDHAARFDALLLELGRRGGANVLVEGGAAVLGCLFDHDWVDEVQVFVAPKIVGGDRARSPVAGVGRRLMSQAAAFERIAAYMVEGDWHYRGRRARGLEPLT